MTTGRINQIAFFASRGRLLPSTNKREQPKPPQREARTRTNKCACPDRPRRRQKRPKCFSFEGSTRNQFTIDFVCVVGSADRRGRTEKVRRLPASPPFVAVAHHRTFPTKARPVNRDGINTRGDFRVDWAAAPHAMLPSHAARHGQTSQSSLQRLVLSGRLPCAFVHSLPEHRAAVLGQTWPVQARCRRSCATRAVLVICGHTASHRVSIQASHLPRRMPSTMKWEDRSFGVGPHTTCVVQVCH